MRRIYAQVCAQAHASIQELRTRHYRRDKIVMGDTLTTGRALQYLSSAAMLVEMAAYLVHQFAASVPDDYNPLMKAISAHARRLMQMESSFCMDELRAAGWDTESGERTGDGKPKDEQ
jgi:hypothetical protein